MQRPSEEEFAEWQQHPATEWVMGVMSQWAGRMKHEWADMAWDSAEIDPAALAEARVRADCYQEIPTSALEDWAALEDRMNDSDS